MEDDIDQSIEDVLTGLQYIFVSVFGSLQKATTVYFDKTMISTLKSSKFHCIYMQTVPCINVKHKKDGQRRL